MLLILFINLFYQNVFSNLYVENISKKIGLSTARVSQVEIDSNRFIWFVTWDGIIRYDGHQSITIDQSSGLKPIVKTVCLSQNNILWVATSFGLQKISTVDCSIQDVKITNNQIFLDKVITDIAVETDSTLIVLNSKNELFRLKTKENNTVEVLSRIALNKRIVVNKLYRKNQNEILVLTNLGLYQIKDSGLSPLFENKLSDSSLGYIFKKDGNELWFGTRKGTLYQFKNKRLKEFQIDLISKNVITKGMSYINNKIFLFSRECLIEFNPVEETQKKFYLMDRKTGTKYISFTMSLLLVDDNLFITTFRDGILQYNLKSTPFKNYLEGSDINGFSQDTKGRVWVTVRKKGLKVFSYQDGYKEHHFPWLNKTQNKSVNDVIHDKKNNIWVSIYPNILLKHELLSKKTKEYTIDRKYLGSFGFVLTDRGEILVKTRTALIHFDPFSTVFKNVLFHDNSITLKINDVKFDNLGNYWIASNGKGVLYYNVLDSSLLQLDDNYLSDKYITTLRLSKNDDLWIGTTANGIYKVRNPKSKLVLFDKKKNIIRKGNLIGDVKKADKHFSKKDGLQNNRILSILEAADNKLWIGTFDGLSMIDDEKNSIINFNQSDGLYHNEMNLSTAFISSDQQFIFGSRQGILMFKPREIKLNDKAPKPIITEILINNKLSNKAELLNLAYSQNTISIQFSAMDYSNPLNNCYKTILEGYQENWLNCTDHKLTYINIKPGDYQFKLNASNNHNVWAKEPTVLNISISKPFWNSNWFYICIVFVIFLVIYSIYKIRINKLIAFQSFRESLARDLHDEIGSTLISIGYFADILEKRSKPYITDSIKLLISQIKRASGKSHDAVRDMSYSLTYHHTTWPAYVKKIEDYLFAQLQNTEIKYLVIKPLNLPDTQLPHNINFQLWMVVKEIIANAIRHSKCSILKVKFKYSKSYIRIFISDNGIGLKKERSSGGTAFGIRNIGSRLKKINGKYRIYSLENKGTIFFIKIKI
jgi:ligand-binding sensor domain-containing protein/two-component sensor histidine kinase